MYVYRDSFGSVESVKAASDVYAPVSGEVLEINDVSSWQPTHHALLCFVARDHSVHVCGWLMFFCGRLVWRRAPVLACSVRGGGVAIVVCSSFLGCGQQLRRELSCRLVSSWAP